MTRLDLSQALDRAIEHAMTSDPTIVVIGEDVPAMRAGLYARFGPDRVLAAPISESAFLGAGVGAAMSGLRPVVEIMLVDFLAVALNPLLNEATKVRAFSGGRWTVPLVIRAACGGGYGDAGQHEQALWGMLAGIPDLVVAVPSTPADAAGLMLAALRHDGPAIVLEHKLLSPFWLEQMAGSRRPGIVLDVPEEGMYGEVPDPPQPVPLGEARLARQGDDVVVFSLGVGVHRALEAAARLEGAGIGVAVVDLRTAAPLDVNLVIDTARGVRAVVVVDEDYETAGLTGEVAAVLAEAGVRRPFRRVAAPGVIPYARRLEEQVLPNVQRIEQAVLELLG
jgi:acetoin:2,6-dichlorophenolindophenol oxidoreductase subunit beta